MKLSKEQYRDALILLLRWEAETSSRADRGMIEELAACLQYVSQQPSPAALLAQKDKTKKGHLP